MEPAALKNEPRMTLRVFAELVYLSLLEPLRDKIAYFWSLIQPVLGIAFVAVSSGHLKLEAYDLGKYAIYICFVNSFYTTGATLLWKRESGLLRGFLRSKAARARLIQVHIASSVIYAIAFASLLLGVLAMANQAPVSALTYLSIIPVGIFASVMASIGSLVMMRWTLSVGNTSAMLNIFAFALAVLSFFVTPAVSMYGWLQTLNPITLLAAALYYPMEQAQAYAVYIAGSVWMTLLLAAGALGYFGLQPRPSNLR